MCLGIPGKVVWIKDTMAGVDFGEVVVEAGTHIVNNLSVGDYVLVHAGFILEKLDMDEVQKTLELFDELARVQQGPS
ncbi:MAG: HypC/HybG/HupF family hydrogenase formation chaperone [Chitinispirillaceae bacterium]|nr:HypC/HybG/HupF family hydrogenase formation chaperone [Chitinispirillaceae bacterium]